MKNKLFSGLVVLLCGSVFSDISNMEFVTIGNDGNATGGVDYHFLMGKYEVTASQWGTFVSTGGITHGYTQTYQSFDDPVWVGDSKPAVKISWYDAAQYCNWLTSGTTTNGAYQFDSMGSFAGVDRAAATQSHTTVYVLPTINEWNKAGYFNGSVFTTFANGTGTIPSQSDANYDNLPGGSFTDVDVWDVGTGTEEQNGTFDMMGNVWEWTENPGGIGDYITGGAAHWTQEQWLRYRSESEGGHNSWYSDDGTSWLGLRVAAIGSSVIPEPASLALVALVGGGTFFIRRLFFK